ncbi:MAG TPA: peptidase domain-containing ABC transporter [Ferruginibacter sp.]|nr:peptidase domain-containing ABC transporter [Ferruginibacter sp.]
MAQKHIDFFQQRNQMDCGPTSLYMVSKYHGRNFNIEKLRELTEIGKEGVNILGISDAAEKIGYRTHAMQLNIKELNEVPLPCILHWGQNHFVVLYKIKKQHYFVADPGRGLLKYQQKEFEQKWISSNQSSGQSSQYLPPTLVGTGIALLLEPTPSFYNNIYNEDYIEERRKNFSNIIKYLYPYKKLIVQLVLGLLLGSLLQLVFPFLTQSIVDTGINTGNLHFIYIILFAQLALFAGRLSVDFIKSWILYHISSRINISILTDFLIKLMKLPVSYFDSKKTGDIMQRMNDHQRIQSFLTGTSLTTLFSLFNLVIFSVVLGMYNGSIFFIFVAASILYILWILIFLKKRKQLDYKQFDIAAAEQSKTMEIVQGMQEIKLHGCEKQKRWQWERLQARTFKLGMKGLALNQWQQTGAFFINEGKNIVITFLSAKAVIDGQMTLGGMIAIQYIIGQLNSPIEQMISFVQSWQLAKISLDRLNEIHELRDEEDAFPISSEGGGNGGERSGNVLSISIGGGRNGEELSRELPTNKSIELANVSFTYPGAGNEPVLRNISLLIAEGKTTAIVGTSGSGKTTLLKLLLKFYENYKGDIKIGATHSLSSSLRLSAYPPPPGELEGAGAGVGLQHLSHRSWRQHIGVVMQESFIFSDSIAANIAVGDENIDSVKLKEAARVANILEFIESLPLGFYTKIGAEGIGVSAGQKQRILIARAVYKNPDYIIFDEATNSLDANNETIIMKNLKVFFKNKTVIVVAHRLSTVKNADQIVVLHNGIITECGTHTELTNLRGEYYTLVKNQLELGD